MGLIAHLPRSLVTHLRSTSNLPDFAQAVEELICNSLDAGATKVCAFVDLASLFVKVEDNGSGITRDDLTLVGERHATSKLHHLVELEAGLPTLGFRGEALSSLSDIAILEVTSKTRGSPNTFRKIVKDCKTLSIGLCSDQRAPGTTVILRDIFYNLPVRRKLILSSPKKVLQSVREHTLRLALVHPHVSFTVTDLAWGGNLIYTHPTTSSLSTLCSIFGEELQSGLQEWNYCKGHLRLQGFISTPLHRLPSKAIQYFYINRRFVQKTPVHKLLNTFFGIRGRNPNVADDYSQWMGVDEEKTKTDMLDSSWKHAFPAFVLNLSCPLSSYDITFEPTKTTVEFKDWTSVLSFVKEAHEAILGGHTVFPVPGVLKECMEMYSHTTTNATAMISRNKRKSWQQIDPTYHPRCKIDSPSVYTLVREGPLLPKCQFNDVDFSGDNKYDAEDFKMPKSLCKRKHIDSFSGPMLNGAPSLSGFEGCSFTPKKTDQNPDINNWLLEKPASFSKRVCPYSLRASTMNVQGDWDTECSSFLAFVEGIQYTSTDDVSGFTTSNMGKIMETEAISATSPYNASYSPPFCSTKLEYDLGEDIFLNSRPNCCSLSPAAGGKNWSDQSGLSCEFVQRSEYILPHKYEPPLRVPIRSKRTKHVQRCLDVDGFMAGLDDNLVCGGKKSVDFHPAETRKEKNQLNENAMLSSDIFESPDLISHKKYRCFSQTRPTGIADGNFDALYESTAQDMAYKKVYTRRKKKDQNHESWSPVKDLSETFKDHGSAYPAYSLDPVKLLPQWMDSQVLESAPKAFRFSQADASRRFSQERDAGFTDDRNMSYAMNITPLTPKSKLQRSLSGPPFYKPCKKYGLCLTSTLSTLIKNQTKQDNAAGQFALEREVQNLQNVAQVGGKNVTLETSANISKAIVAVRDCRGATSLYEDKQDSWSLQEKPDDSPVKTTVAEPHHVAGDSPVKATVAELYQEWMNPCLTLNEKDILDLSSGVLGPSNKYLLPDSISKENLENARVLKQIGKKFIALVAQGILVVVDQHAADERIRLEQLRQDVLLANKQQSSTLLNYPQEVSITVGDQQLLQTYRSQIEEWGWRFKNISESRETYSRRKGQVHQGTSSVFLSAVPCILGESLEDKNILGEYLLQLAETGGSSTAPPAVLRLLASKACRGAIMFGDLLLQAECRQLIDGLKQTALCFQCAHGRPTTVPLVNLHALHKRLERKSVNNPYRCITVNKLAISRETCNHSDTNGDSLGGKEQWHGLQWHRATLERACERLKRAEQM